MVKCRPPGNRDPEADEIAACAPFLLRQLQSVHPEVIVALGRFAARTLLDTKEAISKLRGKFRDYHGVPVMPTYHPSYLLRNRAYVGASSWKVLGGHGPGAAASETAGAGKNTQKVVASRLLKIVMRRPLCKAQASEDARRTLGTLSF